MYRSRKCSILQPSSYLRKLFRPFCYLRKLGYLELFWNSEHPQSLSPTEPSWSDSTGQRILVSSVCRVTQLSWSNGGLHLTENYRRTKQKRDPVNCFIPLSELLLLFELKNCVWLLLTCTGFSAEVSRLHRTLAIPTGSVLVLGKRRRKKQTTNKCPILVATFILTFRMEKPESSTDIFEYWIEVTEGFAKVIQNHHKIFVILFF